MARTQKKVDRKSADAIRELGVMLGVDQRGPRIRDPKVRSAIRAVLRECTRPEKVYYVTQRGPFTTFVML